LNLFGFKNADTTHLNTRSKENIGNVRANIAEDRN